MRNTFISRLADLADVRKDIVLIVGDLGYGVVEPFVTRHPDKFFNAGVAEQNMIGLAAGLASEAKHVFVYSIANFPTFRCAEHIRNDIDYHKLGVTIVAVGGGVSYGNLGYSHHAIQDYALIRNFPNTLICAPGDPEETRLCLDYLVQNPQPSYLRLAKSAEPSGAESNSTLVPGQWRPIFEARNPERTFLTTGNTLNLVKNSLNKSNLMKTSSLYSVPMWGHGLIQSHAERLRQSRSVITVEDHLHSGGFGSWTLECANSIDDLDVNVTIKALRSTVALDVGSEQYLWDTYGLSEADICE